ncbi:MAG: NUDIX hydrolase [Candidatus Vogelbacteria bacterium]|nr:NUDIX hydrolase [Candidatus Vogelbacteria bacterium]
MSNKITSRMNTKFVGHHVSSGGFIFFEDKKTRELDVLLIRNKKNEYWIPKGHIEKGEDQVAAALREIEEEVGLEKDQIKYIDLCVVYKFSFVDDNGKPNTKEIYMNLFEAYEKYDLRQEEGSDVTGADWFEYSKALEVILPFSKNELMKAREMFEDYSKDKLRFLHRDFQAVKKDLPSQSFAKDLTCFIVFGSSVVNNNMGKVPDDVDVCVVVKNRDADLHKISEYIFSSFKKPDFRIYFQDEVDSDLQFVDVGIGVFAMEYFANGVALYGKNIFVDKLKTVSKTKLKESYLNKIFEYILRIRVAYVAKTSTHEYKMWHIHKYVIRLSIDILLYNGFIDYGDLKDLTKYEIINLCKKYAMVSDNTEVDFENLVSMYELFEEISLYVVKSHATKS